MKKIEIKQFDINEVKEVTLLSIEEAKRVPKKSLRACGDWWWLQSPSDCQNIAVFVYSNGDINKDGNCVNNERCTVRPAFRINNLKSKIGDKIMVGKTWCTVIKKDFALADYPICQHIFDLKSNDWETSELKAFIESDEFKAMI